MEKIVLFIFLAFISCSGQNINQSIDMEYSDKKYGNAYRNKQLEKKTATGDFNGDGKQDTIFQNNINAESVLPIDSYPDPWKNEWDTVVMYFTKNYSRITLSSSLPDTDTLCFGNGLGLYCLINIGDNNHDKKDEIAFVIDHTDYSRVNSCLIYTLCGNKWVNLKAFAIHEGAFDYYNHQLPAADHIVGFLEHKRGEWKYRDYDDFEFDSEEVGKLRKLNLKSCE